MFIFALIAAVPLSAAGKETKREVPPVPAILPPPKHAAPQIGERLAFQGRWMGIPVGHGWIEVKELTEVDGRPAYHIEAQGHTSDVLSKLYPIHDVVHSYVDAETLKPLKFEKHQREGRYRSDEVVTFDHTSRKAHYRSLLNKSEKTIDLPDDFQDLISALYWFRAQSIEPGQPLSVNLYTDEKIYTTEIEVQPVATLELLKRGTFPCVVVEPKASFKGFLIKRGRIWAYVTADEHRLPLFVRATTPWGAMSVVIDEDSLKAVQGAQTR